MYPAKKRNIVIIAAFVLLLAAATAVMSAGRADTGTYAATDNPNYIVTPDADAAGDYGVARTGATGPFTIGTIADVFNAIDEDRKSGTSSDFTYADCTVAFGDGVTSLAVTENVPLLNGKYTLSGSLSLEAAENGNFACLVAEGEVILDGLTVTQLSDSKTDQVILVNKPGKLTITQSEGKVTSVSKGVTTEAFINDRTAVRLRGNYGVLTEAFFMDGGSLELSGKKSNAIASSAYAALAEGDYIGMTFTGSGVTTGGVGFYCQTDESGNVTSAAKNGRITVGGEFTMSSVRLKGGSFENNNTAVVESGAQFSLYTNTSVDNAMIKDFKKIIVRGGTDETLDKNFTQNRLGPKFNFSFNGSYVLNAEEYELSGRIHVPKDNIRLITLTKPNAVTLPSDLIAVDDNNKPQTENNKKYLIDFKYGYGDGDVLFSGAGATETTMNSFLWKSNQYKPVKDGEVINLALQQTGKKTYYVMRGDKDGRYPDDYFVYRTTESDSEMRKVADYKDYTSQCITAINEDRDLDAGFAGDGLYADAVIYFGNPTEGAANAAPIIGKTTIGYGNLTVTGKASGSLTFASGITGLTIENLEITAPSTLNATTVNASDVTSTVTITDSTIIQESANASYEALYVRNAVLDGVTVRAENHTGNNGKAVRASGKLVIRESDGKTTLITAGAGMAWAVELTGGGTADPDGSLEALRLEGGTLTGGINLKQRDSSASANDYAHVNILGGTVTGTRSTSDTGVAVKVTVYKQDTHFEVRISKGEINGSVCYKYKTTTQSNSIDTSFSKLIMSGGVINSSYNNLTSIPAVANFHTVSLSWSAEINAANEGGDAYAIQARYYKLSHNAKVTGRIRLLNEDAVTIDSAGPLQPTGPVFHLSPTGSWAKTGSVLVTNVKIGNTDCTGRFAVSGNYELENGTGEQESQLLLVRYNKVNYMFPSDSGISCVTFADGTPLPDKLKQGVESALIIPADVVPRDADGNAINRALGMAAIKKVDSTSGTNSYFLKSDIINWNDGTGIGDAENGYEYVFSPNYAGEIYVYLRFYLDVSYTFNIEENGGAFDLNVVTQLRSYYINRNYASDDKYIECVLQVITLNGRRAILTGVTLSEATAKIESDRASSGNNAIYLYFGGLTSSAAVGITSSETLVLNAVGMDGGKYYQYYISGGFNYTGMDVAVVVKGGTVYLRSKITSAARGAVVNDGELRLNASSDGEVAAILDGVVLEKRDDGAKPVVLVFPSSKGITSETGYPLTVNFEWEIGGNLPPDKIIASDGSKSQILVKEGGCILYRASTTAYTVTVEESNALQKVADFTGYQYVSKLTIEFAAEDGAAYTKILSGGSVEVWYGYKLSYNYGSEVMDVGSYLPGEPLEDGYDTDAAHFIGWYADMEFTGDAITLAPDDWRGARTVYAKYRQKKWILTEDSMSSYKSYVLNTGYFTEENDADDEEFHIENGRVFIPMLTLPYNSFQGNIDVIIELDKTERFTIGILDLTGLNANAVVTRILVTGYESPDGFIPRSEIRSAISIEVVAAQSHLAFFALSVYDDGDNYGEQYYSMGDLGVEQLICLSVMAMLGLTENDEPLPYDSADDVPDLVVLFDSGYMDDVCEVFAAAFDNGELKPGKVIAPITLLFLMDENGDTEYAWYVVSGLPAAFNLDFDAGEKRFSFKEGSFDEPFSVIPQYAELDGYYPAIWDDVSESYVYAEGLDKLADDSVYTLVRKETESGEVYYTVPFIDYGVEYTALKFMRMLTMKTYDLNYDAQGGLVTPSFAKITYYDEAGARLALPSKRGYVFGGWYLDEACTESNQVTDKDGLTLSVWQTHSDGAIILYAKWTAEVYSVTVGSLSGGQLTTEGSVPLPSAHTFGTQTALPSAAKTGHDFIGWIVNGSGAAVTSLGAEAYDADISLTASFVPCEYAISYTLNGGAFADNYAAPDTHVYGTDTAIADPTRTGYTFVGWSVGGEEAVKELTLGGEEYTGDVALEAVWQANKYTVVFHGNGAGGGQTERQEFTYDIAGSLTLNGFTRTGYAFAGWAKTASGTAEYEDGQTVLNLAAAGETALYAVWSAVSYTVVFDGNGNTGGTAPADTTFRYDNAAGDKLPEHDLVKTDKYFAGWARNADAAEAEFGDCAVLNENLADTEGAQVTLYAVWDDIPTYAVSFTGGTGAQGSNPSVAPQREGAVVVLPQNTFTKTGYYFDAWLSGSDRYEAGAEFDMPAEAVVFTASWLPCEYDVTIELNGGEFAAGYTAPDKHVYDRATAISDPARRGYTFDGWLIDSAQTPARELTLGGKDYTADITLAAVWTAKSFSVSYVDTDGAVFGVNKPANHTFGTATPVSDPSKTGYTFAGWKVNGAEIPVKGLSLGAEDYDAAITLTAVWTVNIYTAAFVNGNVSEEREFAYGAAITLPDDPDNYDDENYFYTFDGWTGYTAGMTMPAQSVTFNARFVRSAKIYVEVEFSAGEGVDAPDFGQVFVGQVVTIPDETPEKTGYSFTGWSDGSRVYAPGDRFTVAEGVTLTAVWDIEYYAVRFLNEDGSVFFTSELSYGAAILPPADSPVKASTDTFEYAFKGWTGYEDGMTVPAGGASFTAAFEAKAIPAPAPEPEPEKGKDGLSGGAIAGIAVGSAAAAAIAAFSVIWFGIKKRKLSDLFGKKASKTDE